MAFDRDQIEARLALNIIASADMPQIALGALEAGLDGKAIRRLAVLEHPTYFEVAEGLPRVMQEIGLSQIPIGEAAVRLSLIHISEYRLSLSGTRLLQWRCAAWSRRRLPPPTFALSLIHI